MTPTITRRLGLPLLPLSCLFIRACVQTYHMFLASYATVPTPPSTLTSLVVDAADSSGQSPSPPPSPAITATLEHLDQLIRGSLGRSIYGDPFAASSSDTSKRLAGGTGMAGPSLLYPWRWSADDAVAVATMLVVFTLLFLCFLALKLVLGIILLRVARDRYARVRAREIAVAQGRAEPEPRDIYDLKGSRRIGGYGKVEVGDDRRKMIYEDDVEGLRKAREKERKAMGIPHTEASGEGDGGGKGASGGGGGSGSGRGRGADKEIDWNTVMRYEMINKRIW